MWKQLQSKTNLNPQVSMTGNVYLGCRQESADVDQAVLDEQYEFYKFLSDNKKGEEKTTEVQKNTMKLSITLTQ